MRTGSVFSEFAVNFRFKSAKILPKQHFTEQAEPYLEKTFISILRLTNQKRAAQINWTVAAWVHILQSTSTIRDTNRVK